MSSKIQTLFLAQEEVAVAEAEGAVDCLMLLPVRI